MAYQISFDLEENATQEFLSKVSNGLPSEPAVEEPKEDAMEVEQVRTAKGGWRETLRMEKHWVLTRQIFSHKSTHHSRKLNPFYLVKNQFVFTSNSYTATTIRTCLF